MFLDFLRRLWFYIFDRFILYPLMSWIVPQMGITFMNLGYWPEEDEKTLTKIVESHSKPEDPDRASYYLYEKPLSLHPHYPSLKGLRLLDVACGQGAGLKWIKKAHPMIRELVGVDAVPNKLAETTIVKGNAERMPFDENEFDIVLTVEASHLFEDCSAFFDESYRVLKPGGYLCWADLRYYHQEAIMSGFTEVMFEDITDQVLKGIEHTSAKYDKMLANAPSIVKLFGSSLRATYCAPGTHTHARFVVGEKKYFAALWKKTEL